MNRTFDSAMVIARRDFVATVLSRTFLLFLLAPILAMAFGALLSTITGEADREASRPNVAVLTDADSAREIEAAHERLSEALGRYELPRLRLIDREADAEAQARRLLATPDSDISAALVGSLDRPVLIGPFESSGSMAREFGLIVNDARRAEALSGNIPASVSVAVVTTEQSAGRLSSVRHALARAGQVLIFMLTLLLAGMLLSNLVEEKSNKVIEVLAAAVPLDAVFLGKLIAMLGVSIVGIIIWGAIAAGGLWYLEDLINVPVTPAVGWPAYCVLVVLYFAANYMLLGAAFLGIGGQASNIREVQTLSMPITFAQLGLFFLASTVVSGDGGFWATVAMIFPLSTPLAMIGVAAQDGAIWPHLLALAWSVLWIWIIIKIAAAMFRKTVLKSGPSLTAGLGGKA